MNKSAQFADIKKAITEYIAEKKILAGDKIPPIRRLAKELNASPVTVHRAISSLVSEGALESKRGSGTFVASVEEKKLTIGIVMPPVFANLTQGSFTRDIVKGAESVLSEHKMRAVMCRTREGDIEQEEFDLIKDLLESGVKEFIACLFSHANGPVWKFLEENKIPVVLIDNFAPCKNFNGVATNNYRGGRLVAEHLLSLGHKNLAVASPALRGSAVESRIEGFESVLKEAGIKLPKGNILQINSDKDIERYNSFFTGKDHPTGLFAIHDGVAAKIYKHFRDIGIRIPEDISVIGFDDDEISSQLTPPLSTVRQPAFRIGARAADCLMRIIGNPDQMKEVNEILLDPELLVRESTSKLEGK